MHTAPMPALRPRPRAAANRWGIALALAGALTCWLPLIGVIAWPCVAFALARSEEALNAAQRASVSRGPAWCGLLLAWAAFAVCVGWMLTYAAAWAELPVPWPWVR